MGFLDELKKLTQPYDDDDDFFEESEKPAKTVTVKPRPSSPSAASAGMEFESAFGAQSSAAVPASEATEDEDEDEEMSGGLFGNLGKRMKKENRAVRERTVNFGGKESQVILFNPKSFDEAGELVGHLMRNRSLVMTLEGLPTETARRLLDFMSGIVFALHGKITPVSAKTYFISPENVDLLGADSAAGASAGGTFE
ncbi:MAG: cell division protein SepF [Oscillospiraceae bacterium]|nr:cell division protein SepF [Oscillospiraceae bacterium]